MHIFESDYNLIATGDILYIALKGKSTTFQLFYPLSLVEPMLIVYLFDIGEEFNFCALIDDYEIGKTLGVGGFGKVVLGKHREKKNEVAIKFTDVGD